MAIRILVGASVRRSPDILQAHLSTLQWQILPPDVELDLVHVDDFTDDQRADGRAALAAAGSDILSGVEQVATLDFSDAHQDTHIWQQSAFERVAQNKQLLFDKAVREGYDYVWICDTDLILDRRTLWSMYYAEKPVVSAVYWTHWTRQVSTAAGPQVWLRHPYLLDGRGTDMPSFRRALSARRLRRVWGLGACMLVNVDVLKRGVRYWPLLPELVRAAQEPGMGMLAGEDRTFCVLCERNHIEMYGDAWPDIYHVYHTDDAQHIDGYLREFQQREHYAPLYATYGDHVSLRIMSCEDSYVGTQHVRGRVGRLGLLPEIEEAVLSMQRGDSRMVRVAFPVDYELVATGPMENRVEYRGKTLTLDVTVVDHKPYSKAPVLREEHHRLNCGQFVDMYMYTPEQNEQFGRAERHTRS